MNLQWNLRLSATQCLASRQTEWIRASGQTNSRFRRSDYQWFVFWFDSQAVLLVILWVNQQTWPLSMIVRSGWTGIRQLSRRFGIHERRRLMLWCPGKELNACTSSKICPQPNWSQIAPTSACPVWVSMWSCPKPCLCRFINSMIVSASRTSVMVIFDCKLTPAAVLDVDEDDDNDDWNTTIASDSQFFDDRVHQQSVECK